VWDTTEDIIGTLISSTVRIGNNRVGDITMDVERGDVYLPTDNGGLNVIHTRKTFDPTDDRVDMYDRYSHPAILMHDPVNIWRDPEGNVYLGFHLDAGITILHPDSTSTSYTAERGVLNTTETGSLWAAPLISRTPRIGATFEARPFFRDRDGNLYVGTDRGLTVLHYNRELGRYDTSVTYRSTGVWDTTEDPRGTLLSSEPKIVTRNGFSILHTDGTVTLFSMERDYTSPDPTVLSMPEDIALHAWRDTTNGDVYISETRHLWKDSEGDIYVSAVDGLHVIHPGGSLTRYTSATGQVLFFHPDYRLTYTTTGWRDSQGQFYPVSVVPVLPFGWVSKSWKDADGQLYVICSGDVVKIPRDGRGPIHGYLRSDVIDVSDTRVRVIGWKGHTPPGSILSLQTRTGSSEACWIKDFEGSSFTKGERSRPLGTSEVCWIEDCEGDSPIQVSASKPEIGDIRVEEGKLVIERVPGNIRLFLETGQPKGYFPAGAIVRAKVRGIGTEGGYHYASLQANWYDYGTGRVKDGEWQLLMFMTLHQPFHRLTFQPNKCERFEIDYISIEMPEGWSEWAEAPDPYGSLIPDLDEAHPYLQWRAVFSTNDVNAILMLDEVILASDYGAFLPKAIRLDPNYPNPFNVRTTISYRLSEEMSVKLEILNILGQRVSTLVEGRERAGHHQVVWDGKMEDGRAVGSGVYLYSVRAGDFSAARRMVLLR